MNIKVFWKEGEKQKREKYRRLMWSVWGTWYRPTEIPTGLKVKRGIGREEEESRSERGGHKEYVNARYEKIKNSGISCGCHSFGQVWVKE